METTPPPPGMKALLECCRDIEIYCSRVYVTFAEAHRGDTEMEELWRKTAKEEDNHADQVRLALKLEGSLQSANVSLDAARAMREEMKQLLASVRRKVPTVPEALRLAIDLEKKLSAFHLTQAAAFASSGQKSLFEAMMKADDGHLVRLQSALIAREHEAASDKPAEGPKTKPPDKPAEKAMEKPAEKR